MSIVVPFKALRPVREFVSAVASLPYDVMSTEEARQVVQDNPLSFLRVEKAECDFPGKTPGAEQAISQKARDNLARMITEGVLRQDKTAAFYLYRQQTGGHVQTGIAACVSVAEYNSGRIKTHEHTLAGKERERILHIDCTGAQTGPVFLTYRGLDRIDRLMAKKTKQDPEYDFVAEDVVRHTVWVIADLKDIKALQKAFLSVESLYVADGHHRAAAAAQVAQLRGEGDPGKKGASGHDFMLAVLFPGNQLRIMGYNRAVIDLNGLDEGEFLERVEKIFLITGNFQRKLPQRPHEFGMYLRGNWYMLALRAKTHQTGQRVSALDVSLLQDNSLGPVLGVENPRVDKRIAFIGGSRGAAGLENIVDREGFAVAFSLFPPTVDEMMAVADAGMVMPPKSTWFEPKLRSGLFVHLLDD